MAYFRASAGQLTARFRRDEAAVLRDLVSQIAGLVSAEEPPAAGLPGAGEPRPREPGPGQPAPGDPGADELEALVGIGGGASLPDDPVLARLLPDGYSGDPDAAAEFRRFTEDSLRSAKAAAARTVLDSLPEAGGRIRLSPAQAQDWLRAINDVRLALGVVLGVTDNLDALASQIGPSDPRRPALGLLDWLGYVQSSLVAALS